jgi:hypothetical protein
MKFCEADELCNGSGELHLVITRKVEGYQSFMQMGVHEDVRFSLG